jgi:hypothetical protein
LGFHAKILGFHAKPADFPKMDIGFGHEHGSAGDPVETWKIIGAFVIVCALLAAAMIVAL